MRIFSADCAKTAAAASAATAVCGAGLVAAEVALSVALLAGAGLLFRSLIGLQGVDPGLDASGVLTFRVSLPGARYPDASKRVQFYQTALAQIRALPGVRSASAINYLPFRGMAAGTHVSIAGRPPAAPGEELTSTIRAVTPGYFQAMRIPIRSGRDFSAADNTVESPYRFIINETFARTYLPGKQPLGRQINANMGDVNPFGEVVGVVGDVKEGAVDKEPSPTVYYVHAHMPSGQMVFVVRASGDPRSLAEPLRRVISGLDGAQPVAEIELMETVVRETFSRQRFSALLLIGFSLVSLLLAAVGIYGVLAYTVTERTREFGVRVALGADPGRITALVLGMGARLVLGGTAAGLAGAMLLTRSAEDDALRGRRARHADLRHGAGGAGRGRLAGGLPAGAPRIADGAGGCAARGVGDRPGSLSYLLSRGFRPLL